MLLTTAVIAVGLLAPTTGSDLAYDQLTTAARCMAFAQAAGDFDEADRLFAYAKKNMDALWPAVQAKLPDAPGPKYLAHVSEDFTFGSIVKDYANAANAFMLQGMQGSGRDGKAEAKQDFGNENCRLIGR